MANATAFCFERHEKKYVLTPGQQAYLLQHMQPYTQKDPYGAYTILNLYYDTPDYRLIRTSLEKPVYKEKLRMRSYGVPAADGAVFVELKKKYKGVVYKRRITVPAAEALALLDRGLPAERFGQIGREIAWFQRCNDVQPRVFLAYDRLAFAGREDPEVRITFDTGLRWRETALDLLSGDHGAPLMPESFVLMELKLPGACPMWLTRLLSEAALRPVSFSKYGTFYTSQVLPRQAAALQKGGDFCA